MPMTDVKTVMLHGFQNLDANNALARDTGLPVASQEHIEHDGEGVDGWNVWLRVDWADPAPHGEPFSSVEEFDADFNSLEAAYLYADALADHHETEVDAY